MDSHALNKLRDLGLMKKTAAGAESVRVSAQWRHAPEGQPPAERRQALETWSRGIAEKLARHGGEVIPDSMSVAGLTVEAMVPVDAFDEIEAEIGADGVRLDVIMPRQLIG